MLDELLANAPSGDPTAPKNQQEREELARNRDRLNAYLSRALTHGANRNQIDLSIHEADADLVRAEATRPAPGPDCQDLSWLPH
jgi:hypothetical protein